LRDQEDSMSKIRVWVTMGICLTALAAQAQNPSRKPGLWEITSSMSISGGPQNMPAMPAHTTQVCVTQAMIDKYGGPTSSPPQGQCQMTNVSVTASGMTASLSCTGQTKMTGTVQTTFVDANTTKTAMNITMAMGANAMTMTMQSTATYKGADCGSVQPMTMPASK
jgi:Protein of unknown function (DUF3617)